MCIQLITNKVVSRRLLLYVLLLLPLTSQAKGKARICFDRRNVNIGIVLKAQPVKIFYLTFKNKGSENLLITEIKTDCDCTTTEFSDKPVSPNMSGQIKVKVDLHNFFPCNISKRVAVYTNADAKPVVIKIKGKVMY